MSKDNRPPEQLTEEELEQRILQSLDRLLEIVRKWKPKSEPEHE